MVEGWGGRWWVVFGSEGKYETRQEHLFEVEEALICQCLNGADAKHPAIEAVGLLRHHSLSDVDGDPASSVERVRNALRFEAAVGDAGLVPDVGDPVHEVICGKKGLDAEASKDGWLLALGELLTSNTGSYFGVEGAVVLEALEFEVDDIEFPMVVRAVGHEHAFELAHL